jgi:hypothetical protein
MKSFNLVSCVGALFMALASIAAEPDDRGAEHLAQNYIDERKLHTPHVGAN